MADVNSGRKHVDSRTTKIQLRRTEHEIYSMRGTLVKYEIDIMESEATIDRLRASIKAMEETITEREAALKAATEREAAAALEAAAEPHD